MRNIIKPFEKVKNYWLLLVAEIVFVLLVWYGSNSPIIPDPHKIGSSLLGLLGSQEFYMDLVVSLGLTVKSMLIAILIAAGITYLSTIQIFKPVAEFISKCRYLTITGLVYVFTIISKDGHELKIDILLFGIVPFFVTSMLFIIKDIQKEYELCITLRMNKWRTLYEIVILGKLDQLFEVMRQNFAIAWLMITMVEGLAMSEGGIGTSLIKAAKYLDMSKVFALLLVILLIGIIFDYLLSKTRTWLFSYAR